MKRRGSYVAQKICFLVFALVCVRVHRERVCSLASDLPPLTMPRIHIYCYIFVQINKYILLYFLSLTWQILLKQRISFQLKHLLTTDLLVVKAADKMLTEVNIK